jgi:hypothetical protein
VGNDLFVFERFGAKLRSQRLFPFS